MKKKDKTSGQNKQNRKSLRVSLSERSEKIGDHFSALFLDRLKNVREVRLWVIEWALLVSVVFLLAIVQAIWYGGSSETTAYVDGGNFSEATLGKVNSMNPLYAVTDSEKALARLLFANLVAPDVSGHDKCILAESVKSDETGKIWTVKLNSGMQWSDGQSITANDLVYTVGLLADSSAKTTVAANFSKVKIEKVDDLTVKFSLPSAYADFMNNLEFPLVPEHILGKISPALVYESDFSSNPVGSGPFVLNATQNASSSATDKYTMMLHLNRNTKYFLKNTKLDSFTLKTYASSDDILRALKNLDVMATAELGISQSTELEKQMNLRQSLLNSGVFAFLNTKTAVLSKQKVRQAIQQGVDMSVVRSDIDTAAALDYPILEQQEAGLNYPELPKYDLEAAKKLIEAAGYKYNNEGKIIDADGNTMTLSVAVQKRETIATVAERLAEQLKKLGFEVTLSEVDEAQATTDFFASTVQPRNYDILVYGIDMGVNADPFVYYSSTQATNSGWNFSNYADGLMDDALLSARTTMKKDLRKAKYESFLKMWVNNVPAIGLYRQSLNYYYAKYVDIYSEDAVLTNTLDRFADVQFWSSEKRTANLTP